MQAYQQFSSFFFQPSLLPSSTSTYRVNATSGSTCILMQTDGILSIQYRDKLNEDKEADVYLPDYPTLSGLSLQKISFFFCCHSFFSFLPGICDNSDESSMTLQFRGIVLSFYFEKTPGKFDSILKTINV